MTYAEKMRRTRNNVAYCYMQYNDIRQKRPKVFIAFLEGYDAPYYLPFITVVTGLDSDQVICGNKKNVIAVHESLLNKGVLNLSKTGFFIDRDFDDNSVISHRGDYYITRGYSVENYYCSKQTFERILKSYMHYNCVHKDYDVLVNNYIALQEQYNQAILEFNAWYCSLKRNGRNVSWCLDEKMHKGYVDMDLENFLIQKNYTMRQIHQDYDVFPQPSVIDVQKWEEWIKKDIVFNVRGKYEFSFLLDYLKSLEKVVNDPTTAFEEHSMHFSMGQKDAISALAQYAEKDDDLKDYIRKRAA